MATPIGLYAPGFVHVAPAAYGLVQSAAFPVVAPAVAVSHYAAPAVSYVAPAFVSTGFIKK